MNTSAAFWANVECGPVCWEWQASRTSKGYGQSHWGGKHVKAHRLAWELARGPIPPGLCVLHRCDNPPCCRPGHLFIGTRADNNRDSALKGRGALGERNGARTHPDRLARGERNGAAKLTAQQVAEMKSSFGFVSMGDLARRYSVSRRAVGFIRDGKSWGHVQPVERMTA